MLFDKRRAAVLVSFFLIASLVQSSENQVLVYKKKYVMGTIFEIAVYDQSAERASHAIEKALQEVVRLDEVLSNYKPDSPLSRLNRSAHFHQEEVPPDLYRAIQQAVQFSRLSGGKFDISIAPLVNLWKANLGGENLPSLAQQEEARACVGYEKIELIPPDRISFRSPCMQLDLGAIGKGYAVDRAAEVLRSMGIRDALINAGGSTILGMGSPPNQKGWLIHLRDPSNKIDPQVILKDESVSTSEQTRPSLLGKDSAGHIVDPETGTPLKTDFAVSAVTKTGTDSDGLSTTLLLLGPAKGKELIKGMAGFSAIWISPEAQVETVAGGPQIFLGRSL
ncbi:MAG TPA: FAD:protein FMN transferase [Candidatus Sulfotelmatobacter sp.]|nr:FAD:protein FMN transferase [Candidatus Sulfotelmatobacter sp.]